MWNWVIDNWGYFSFVAGSLLTGVLFVIGLWLQHRWRRLKKPVVLFSSRQLLKSEAYSHDDLSFSANGLPVKQLTMTKITFWNAGRDVIEKNDVIQPITLSMNADHQMVGWKILRSGDGSNRFIIQKAQVAGVDALELDFEYVDYQDGMAMTVAHTGRGNRDIKLEGKMKTVQRIQRIDLPDSEKAVLTSPRFLLLVIVCTFSFMGSLLSAPILLGNLLVYLGIEPMHLKWHFYMLGGLMVLAGVIIMTYVVLYLSLWLLFPFIPAHLKTGTRRQL